MTLLFLALVGCTDGSADGLTLAADPRSGPLPLTVTFTASGDAADQAAWDFGDGTTASGATVEHTFLASGRYTVEVRRADSDTLEGSGPIHVEPGVCPDGEVELVTGTIADDRINEASGLVASQKNSGVLWTHNDSGDDPRLYAIDEAGNLLSIVDVLDVSRGDWEDLALGRDPDTGEWLLVAGDVGDNNHDKADVHLHFVVEPDVSPGQRQQDHALPARTLDLTYPDGLMLDCESVLVDPVTQDVYLVTKDYGGPASVYRKAAPHQAGTTSELELVADLDFSEPPLSGNATTGGDFSPLGDRAVIRTYGATAYMFRRDQSEPVEAMWEGEPCAVRMPFERQSESITFGTDGQGLWSLSEGEFQPVNYVPFSQD